MTDPAEMPDDLTERALDAFWQVIADEFPAATTGDLSPHATIALRQAAGQAIKEWIENNVPDQS